MMQYWSILLASLLANINGESLKGSESSLIAANCQARYDLMKPIHSSFFGQSIQRACFKWKLNVADAVPCILMVNRINKEIRQGYLATTTLRAVRQELINFKGISEQNVNFIAKTVIGGWGTLQQFIDCSVPSENSMGGAMATNISLPSSWTYPPKGFPSGRGQQTKKMAEANIRDALDKAKIAIENVDEWVVVNYISAFLSTGFEVLDFEKRNSVNYASFGGAVVRISSEGKIVGACKKRFSNDCSTISEFTLGGNDHPTVNVNVEGIMNEAINEKVSRAFLTSLHQQGILLDDSEIH